MNGRVFIGTALLWLLSLRAYAAEPLETLPRELEIPFPFVTAHGQFAISDRVQEGQRFPHLFAGGGGALTVHIDISDCVVPYLDAQLAYPAGTMFATAGVIVGHRTHTRLSIVSTAERNLGNGWVERTTTSVTWGDKRYPLVLGAQIGAGFFGHFAGESGRSNGLVVPFGMRPRIEIGPSLLGQHILNALFTIDPEAGVLGFRGSAIGRGPLGITWLSSGITWDVVFNNSERATYDFVVGALLGVGFSTNSG